MWSSRCYWALLVFKFLCLKLLVHDSFGSLPTRFIHHQLFSDIESDLEVKYSFEYAEHQNSWLVESAILKCFWPKVKCFFVRKREFHSAKFKWLPSGYLYMQGDLFECGDIHPHPGPLTCRSAVRHDSSRRKCKECDQTIASNHCATRCDCCSMWSHIGCGGVTPKQYLILQSSCVCHSQSIGTEKP